jgi:hypothetical protein
MRQTVLHQRQSDKTSEYRLESKNWSDVPPSCTRLWVDVSKTRSLAPLAAFRKLQTLSVGHLRDEDCPHIAGLARLRTLFLYVPNIASLTPLAGMDRLEGLHLMHGAKVRTLAGLEGMRSLKYLYAYNIPRVNDLSPLRTLAELRELDLQMSWATTKQLSFQSLAPLAGLTKLELLNLVGVKTDDDSLRPLGNLKRLKHLFPGHWGLPIEELAYLAAVLNRQLDPADRLHPTRVLKNPNGTWSCKKCGGPPLQLVGRVGSRYRFTACPDCDATTIAEREEIFAAARRQQGRRK